VQVGICALVAIGAGAFAVALPGSSARAQGGLEYRVDPRLTGCPGADVVRDAVAAQLGHDPFAGRAPVRVSLTIAARGSGAAATIEVTEPRGGRHARRELVSPEASCADLAKAAALALAIAIDPRNTPAATDDGSAARPSSRAAAPPSPGARRAAATTATAASTSRTTAAAEAASAEAGAPGRPTAALPAEAAASAPAPAPPPPGAAAAAAAAGPVAERREDRPWQVLAGAGLALSGNVQPAPAPGVTLALEVRRRSLGLGVEAQVASATELQHRGGAVSARLLAAAVLGCWQPARARVCAVGAGGALRGVGSGFRDSRRDLTPFAAAGVRVGWRQPLAGRWSLGLDATALVPLVRTALWVDDATVWTSPRVGAQGSLVLLRAFR
jgi:hypothetical protein